MRSAGARGICDGWLKEQDATRVAADGLKAGFEGGRGGVVGGVEDDVARLDGCAAG